MHQESSLGQADRYAFLQETIITVAVPHCLPRIALVMQEKEEASKRYFENLIKQKPAASGSGGTNDSTLLKSRVIDKEHVKVLHLQVVLAVVVLLQRQQDYRPLRSYSIGISRKDF